MSVAAWTAYHHTRSPSPSPGSSSTRRLSHLRSHSSTGSPTGTSSASSGKPRSNTSISNMAAEVASLTPATPQPQRVYAGLTDADFDLSTIPDPRSRSMTPANMDGTTSRPQHPELSDEVATLSTKLINAINHQTSLDDTLSQTRSELERSRDQIRSMKIQLEKQREMLAGDIWIRRKSAEAEKTGLLARIAEEKKARMDVEQEKKKIEQELENLTAALFEEANKMVISAKEDARREHEVLQRKNDLLKAQLADTEGLLKSQQEQLVELKRVMEQMTAEQDDQTATTSPSSPGFSKFDSRDDDTQLSEGGSQSVLSELIAPSYPTSFTHFLQPVLRFDLDSYEDFVGLCRISRGVSSRPPSGTHVGLGLGLMGPIASAGSIPTSSSTGSLSAAGSPASANGFSPQTPNTPASAFSAPASTSSVPIPPLKDTKFYKRVLAEDVEPTLRLDLAPRLSWLARRSVLTAMSDGSLVVEPVPTTTTYALLSKPQLYPCSLCGENRKDDEHLRWHRFRTSETNTAQRYPLCKYCLTRVRSTCDFLSFLRIVKDGHWRTEDEDAEKAAWEESVRLREQMFWARIGGGVRPIVNLSQGQSGSAGEKSPRASQDKSRPEKDATPAPTLTPGPENDAPETDNQTFATAPEESAPEVPEEQSNAKDSKSVLVDGAARVERSTEPETQPEPHTPQHKRESTQSLPSRSADGEDPERLSIHTPVSP